MNLQEPSLRPEWVASLAARGIVDPTPVQRAVWAPFLSRKDLIVQSGTGTGKTLAYLLPLLQSVDPTRKDLQALVLVPTQELAVQILRVMEDLAKTTSLRVLSLAGGASLPRQLDALKSKPHAVVGTPGRILELLEKKKITGHHLASVVLDEADRLFDEANLATVRAILKTTLKTRQTTLFSASVPPRTEAAAAEFLREPVVLRIDSLSPVPSTIAHWSFQSDLQGKADLLRKILHARGGERTLVFLNKPDQVENLATRLNHHGVAAVCLHGTMEKEERKQALGSFARGAVAVLVASDLAARGLDLPQVACVVHFDVPEEPRDYQHRCGRTGRAGAEGLSVVLATEYEEARLTACEKTLGITIQPKGIRQGVISDARR